MKFLGLIFGNLKRSKTRTILTVGSIAVAFLLFGYLAAIRVAFTAGIEVAGEDRLITREKVSLINSLPKSYEADMERLDGVDNAVHQSWFGGIYQEPRNFFPSVAMEPAELFDMFPEFVLGDAEKQAFINTRTGAIVGRKTAERFGWNVGDRVPLNSPIWPNKSGDSWDFEIVGIYDGAEKGTDTTQLFFQYDYLDEARQYGQGQVGWYTVRVTDPARAGEIATAVDALFANSSAETKTEPEGAFIQGFANQIGNIGFIIMCIVAAVFFTILLVAANTMAYTVRERTNELAVLKAIGFTDGAVLGLVLGEALVLTAIGGLLGLGLAALLVAGGDPTGNMLPMFYLPVKDVILGLVLIVVLAVVAGILPARSAQKLRVADALRR
ncbi:FtsX-like permease family protein [Marinihelvus fidelis]|uniref:FtsX-like permease family protein n=1 Tax=Marinihelvus fidelis TaxID=2613842 RepID=A0A5N0T910_9GAMM|nr:FtsX-like permease family protein [Marinihelvus fidelis]KAA9131440.1 FtsX-like permease family protein [Marinihelvus fidelis]